MSNIRRYPLNGHPVFLTLVCYQRKPLLSPENHKNYLLHIARKVKQLHPFHLHAWVMLPDHLHLLISTNSEQLSTIVQKIKLRFTYQIGGGRCWQRRYWDHICRDQVDVRNHMDYIHYNPVKHGLAVAPLDYEWSSFNYYYRKGFYSRDWGANVRPRNIIDAGNE